VRFELSLPHRCSKEPAICRMLAFQPECEQRKVNEPRVAGNGRNSNKRTKLPFQKFYGC
jgi:hypothetical protein